MLRHEIKGDQNSQQLSDAELESLKQFSSPTIANAIETFNNRRRDEGYMDSNIKCIFPDLGPIVGYACTAQVSARNPPTPQEEEKRYGYLQNIEKVNVPRIAVIQDVDQPINGAFWGEVNASLHKALGCVGTITNGAVRDLDEVHRLGYRFFASGIIASHAYVHITSYSVPVKVGGLEVGPGDLLYADKNGVVKIPSEIAREVVAAAVAYSAREAKLISFSNSSEFKLDRYIELFRQFRSKKEPERKDALKN